MTPRSGGAAVKAALAGVAIVVAAAAWLASSGPRDPSTRARAVEATLRCPTCQATSVADSPALAARQIRRVVEQQVQEGRTDDQIRAYFAARYGQWVLLDPPAAGPGLLVWLLPGAVLLLGTLALVRRALRAHGGPVSPTASPPRRRAAELAVLGAMVVALAAPIPAALSTRAPGRSTSGGAPSATPSIPDLEAWVAANPSDAAALTQLGDALLASGGLAEAADRYRAALAAEPAAVGPKLGLAAILIESGRPDVAVSLVDSVLASDGTSVEGRLMKMLADEQLFGPADPRVRADASRFLEVAAADDPRRAVAEELLSAAGASAPPFPTAGPGSPNP